jgi:hypothetical protein
MREKKKEKRRKIAPSGAVQWGQNEGVRGECGDRLGNAERKNSVILSGAA